SYSSPTPLRGLRQAREPGTLLVWDANHILTWLSPKGEVKARWEAPAPVASVDCADDGSATAVAGATGQVWFLAADQKLRWQRSVGAKTLSVAVAPFGGVLAMVDGGGTVHILDDMGNELARAGNPRPLLHLAFVPERPLLV